MGIIISAFPGCGKTFLTQMGISGLKVMDSDSSTFNKSEFPNNYIQHIKDNVDGTDILFCSSHKEVRDALNAEGIDYDLFYPSKERKLEFLKNYVKRHSTPQLIQKIDHHFDEWIDEIDNEESEFCHKHKMPEPNHFIGNDLGIQKYISAVTNKKNE